MKKTQTNQPFTLIIFGASGDLAKLKLFPALYSLMEQKKLPEKFQIVGYARTKKSNKEFQKEFEESIKASTKTDAKILKNLTDRVSYFAGQYDNIEDFKKLREHISTFKIDTKLAYFSVPPVVFKDILQNLGETQTSTNEDLRLIIEKPFGQDKQSANKLFHFAARYFDEENIYLLDHYLGKSAVQSLLHLRHSNRLLNIMMKGPEISNIQITASEEIGVNTRAGYFDQVGTMKDMIQSHLLQILALITMSIPITENPESLHREKYSILSALKFIEKNENLVLGQYQSYKKENDVPKNSQTETFAAVRLFIDRESWYNTPIYIRTGKKLHEKHTYIVVELKKFAFQAKEEEPNRLIFELQPDEKLSIRLINKQADSMSSQSITTSDSIACEGDSCLPENAQLLLDVLQKRRLHFLSFQEVIATWELTDTIQKFRAQKKPKLEVYKDGTEGPKSQDKLTEMDSNKWFDIH